MIFMQVSVSYESAFMTNYSAKYQSDTGKSEDSICLYLSLKECDLPVLCAVPLRCYQRWKRIEAMHEFVYASTAYSSVLL